VELRASLAVRVPHHKLKLNLKAAGPAIFGGVVTLIAAVLMAVIEDDHGR
jgi:hypothetical protein